MEAKFTQVTYLVSRTYMTTSQTLYEVHDSSPQPRASGWQRAVGEHSGVPGFLAPLPNLGWEGRLHAAQRTG